MSIRYSFFETRGTVILPDGQNRAAIERLAGRQNFAMARTQGRSRDDWTTGIFRTVRALAGLTE